MSLRVARATATLITAQGPADVLTQYGAIGVALLGTGIAVRVLFQREIKAHDLDRERADRMEKEVQRLNTLIQEKVMPMVSDATRSLGEATRIIIDAMNLRRKSDR